jgi:hypothetical protein
MKTKKIIYELKEHIPFTIIATLIAVLIIMYVQFILKKEIPDELFHTLHPLHILVSAIATSGIYYKYKKNIFQAILIGIIGAIIIGSISDIIFPYLGGTLLNLNTEFHLPIIENTLLILLVAAIGSVLGTFKITKIPHMLHVLLSVFASLFYLITFSPEFNMIYFIASFFIVFIAVIIPCCISDIIFPLLFVRRKK